ncbi:MAG: hypothetical protein ACYTFK_12545 [Planctomycetota bacterium]|jgi:hypothetical protein
MRITESERLLINEEISAFNARLMEMGCDSVQVIATATYAGDCICTFREGKGNLYARHGAVRCWLNNQNSLDLANEIGEVINYEEGD